MKSWWFEYWWILTSLLYVIVLVSTAVILTRRGTAARTFPKIALAVNCGLILFIPTMHPPGSYINAVLVVLNLLIWFRSTFNSESSSHP
jgi:hypothetical protein